SNGRPYRGPIHTLDLAAALRRRYRAHDIFTGPGRSMRSRYGAPMALRPGSSQWEAVQGPMTHSGPGSSMRRRYRGPWQITGLAAAMGGP
ncbi:unnamed protein product, partial [Staurois parvus]